MLTLVFASVAGFVVQGTSTLWVVSVGRRSPIGATMFSVLYNAAILCGMHLGLNSLSAALAYIAGGAVASFLVVRFRRREEGYELPVEKDRRAINRRVRDVF